ncbi:MAG: oligosaccharide flippase family protein [Alcanivoracaceae bacterium]|nr:oligosaccharide flippase family protein [Alcanivoracaceae bacterium]
MAASRWSQLLSRGALRGGLARALSGNFIIRVAFTLLGFANAILLARLLGVEGYGFYAAVVAMLNLLVIPSQFGFPVLATREIARADTAQDMSMLRGVMGGSFRLVLLFSMVTVTLTCLSLIYLPVPESLRRPEVIWLVAALVPLAAATALLVAWLRGIGNVVLAMVPEQVVKPLGLLTVLSAFFLLGRSGEIDALDALSFYFLATMAALLVALYHCARRLRPRIAGARPQTSYKAWLLASVPIGLSGALQIMNGQADLLLLGALGSLEDVGIYRVAIQLSLLVLFFKQVVNSVLAPRFASLWSSNDRASLQRLVRRSSLLMVFSALPILLFFLVLGEWAISLAFGADFAGAYDVLLILLAGQLVNVGAGSVGLLLNMTGHSRDVLRAVFFGSAFLVIGCLLLVPEYGAAGAAVANAVSVTTWNLIMFASVRVRLGISPSILWPAQRV